MKTIMGIEYGRGCLSTAIEGGPALAPKAVQEMFPNENWVMVVADPFDAEECKKDRFGENFKIQKKIYQGTPKDKHIMIGGDHSVNFGHFAALADRLPDQDLCLVYIDAHLDIHTPESAVKEASGAPHGTNVRALLGTGDERWLGLQSKKPALKPENVFYLGTRSYEPAEINFAKSSGIYMRTPSELKTQADWEKAVSEIKQKIGNRPFVVSLDFDAMDPSVFKEVLVPATDGLSFQAVEFFTKAFKDAHSFEFVEYAPSGDKESAKIVNQLVGIVLNN